MNKNEIKFNKLIAEIEPLINKNVFFDGKLYKIIKFNSIYVYGNEYIPDNELLINNDIIFFSSCEPKTTYQHFSNNLLHKPSKFKYSSFCRYIVVPDNIDDIYFIDKEMHLNYVDSKFLNKPLLIERANSLFKFIYSMMVGPMKNKSDPYYRPIRDEQIIINMKYFENITDDDIKLLCDEIHINYPRYEMNYFRI